MPPKTEKPKSQTDIKFLYYFITLPTIVTITNKAQLKSGTYSVQKQYCLTSFWNKTPFVAAETPLDNIDNDYC